MLPAHRANEQPPTQDRPGVLATAGTIRSWLKRLDEPVADEVAPFAIDRHAAVPPTNRAHRSAHDSRVRLTTGTPSSLPGNACRWPSCRPAGRPADRLVPGR